MMNDVGISKAPFDQDQLMALELYQVAGYMHPLTCGSEQHPAIGHTPLVPSVEGLFCPVQHCTYFQDWAPGFMTDLNGVIEAAAAHRRRWGL